MPGPAAPIPRSQSADTAAAAVDTAADTAGTAVVEVQQHCQAAGMHVPAPAGVQESRGLDWAFGSCPAARWHARWAAGGSAAQAVHTEALPAAVCYRPAAWEGAAGT